ncbi:MAG: hypothetical protein HYY40_08740 [Bacteroidetes bacterium]|nr:hypothetical protein [Bacteroidota bacterium]
METTAWMIIAAVIIYIAVCFGKIAGKHGKNPVLYGILSVISPVNLIILGYWAFSDSPGEKKN